MLTPSGLVDIETIDIGDLVMAWREDGTGYGAYPVSALIRPPSRVIWQLTLIDAQGNIETFETTDDHPWHVSEGPVNEGHDGAAGNQGNFLRTDELAAGMEISTQDGDGVSVIEVIKTTERAPTYNLTVADAHTFFVGNDGIWVHNTDCTIGPNGFVDRGLEADFQRSADGFGGDRQAYLNARQTYSGGLAKTSDVDPAADALARDIGGESNVAFGGDASRREFDAVSDTQIGLAKGSGQSRFNGGANRQANATFRAAAATKRGVVYTFTQQPIDALVDSLRRKADRFGVPVDIRWPE